MGRNEIRLRRKLMSSGRIAQHRNYGEIMARHERDVRLKRIIKIFIYFLISVFMIIVYLLVNNWMSKKQQPTDVKTPIANISILATD